VPSQWNSLASQFSDGLDTIMDFLEHGPLHLTQQQVYYQIQVWLRQGQHYLQSNAPSLASEVVSNASAVVDVLTVLALALFVTIFFLASGGKMWRWFLNELPATMRESTHRAAGAGWYPFAGYARGTVLVALTFIDFDTQLLPDSLTLPLLWGGLLLNLSSHGMAPLPDAVIGAMTGYLSLWSVYWLFKLITGKEGMGYGDFKLLAALGAWFGWQALPAIILMSSVIGAVVGVGLILFKGHGRSQPIPFGPYLAGAGLAMLFLGGQVMTWMGLGVQPSVIIGP